MTNVQQRRTNLNFSQLVGPTRENLVHNPSAVVSLHNQLYFFNDFFNINVPNCYTLLKYFCWSTKYTLNIIFSAYAQCSALLPACGIYNFSSFIRLLRNNQHYQLILKIALIRWLCIYVRALNMDSISHSCGVESLSYIHFFI